MDPLVTAFEQLRARRGGDPIIVGARARASVEDVDALARMAQSALERSRIPSGAPVGLMAPNGPGFLAGLIALRRAGHPAALLDPRDTPECENAHDANGALPALRVTRAWPRGRADFRVAHPKSPTAEFRHLPEGTAVIKMTSGSTGESRGVAVTSEALLADDAALRASAGIGTLDRLIAAVPFAHSYGLGSLVLPALVAGIVVAIPEEGGPFAPILAARRCAVTVLHNVPAWFAAHARLAETPPMPDSLRLVISAGGPLPQQVALAFRRRCGLAIHAFYGATECGGIAYDREGDSGERGTVGEPIEGVRVTLQPVPGFESRLAGRVMVESPAVGLGYVAMGMMSQDGRAASLGEGRFTSQDLAQLDGGDLRLLGRLDELINVHGRKVRPAEVEQVITEIDGVEGVVVHAFHDGREGDPSVRAVVACARGTLTPNEVLERCRGRLSEFKIPRTVLFVEELPRTGRGKIDRVAVARMRSLRSLAHG